MNQDLFMKALEATQQHKQFAFASLIESTLKGTPRKPGAKMIVFADGSTYGSIGGGRNEAAAIKECLSAISSRKSKTVTYSFFGKEKGQSICGGQIKVFIEPFIHNRHLIICGAGHIALPLSVIAKTLDYKVTIIDNRRKWGNSQRFPHVEKVYAGEHSKQLNKITITPETYIMIVTQGNETDYICLCSALATQAGYIGVISSKAKRIKFFKRLKEDGFSPQQLKRISIPAGHDIGAQTPAEIAISIMAELTQNNNACYLETDKYKDKKQRA